MRRPYQNPGGRANDCLHLVMNAQPKELHPPTRLMKILLADDHPIMRNAYKSLLRQTYTEAEFGEAADSDQAITVALDQPWDIMILDISMPGCGGMAVLKRIHEQRPQIPVLVASLHEKRPYVLRAFQAGAAGYLTKASAGAELINAVEYVLAGGRYVSSEYAEHLLDEASLADGRMLEERLSQREVEVMREIASGKSVSEIACGMLLSNNSIRTYRARILQKMRMITDAELTHYSISNSLFV